MSEMLYPCMLCAALLMCLFVLCVACLTVFVNCLVRLRFSDSTFLSAVRIEPSTARLKLKSNALTDCAS